MHDVVDLDWSTVEHGRAQMRDVGACELPGFVRLWALGMFVEDARRVAPSRIAAGARDGVPQRAGDARRPHRRA